jgi:hypothetical protein
MKPKNRNVRSAVRKASADALERVLTCNQGVFRAESFPDLLWLTVKLGRWTRRVLRTAIDDLVADGRAEVLPGYMGDGYIRIRLVRSHGDSTLRET